MPATGPKTTEGKAVVSLNAVRHGLQTVAIVIPGAEDPEDWAQFRSDVAGSLAPDNALESALADRVAELLWRLRRVPRAEHDLVVAQHRRERAIEQAERPQLPADNFYASAVNAPPLLPALPILPRDEYLRPIVKYEAHLSRQLYLALHEIEALQSPRTGRQTPLARVDVHLPDLET